ncbi:hypothetical protein K2X30_05385 [bacterium]|nr:hypothetical protein [bacterium]
MQRLCALVLGGLLITSLSQANQASQLQDEKYFTVTSASLEEMRSDLYGDGVSSQQQNLWERSSGFAISSDNSLGNIVKGVLGEAPDLAPWNVFLDQVINMGKKIWDIVESNRPVVDLKTDVANAVPQGITSWQDLGQWQAPRSKVYTLAYKNLYGIEVIRFDYRVLYTAGGSYNGVGRYLANVSIVPGEISVAWGYKFAAKNSVASTLNVGTKQNPVGGMEMIINWSIDTPFKHTQSSGSYFVQGDGKFVDLTNGNSLL